MNAPAIDLSSLRRALGWLSSPTKAPPPLALTPTQSRLVRRLIDGVLPGAKVAVFGSRATGHARPHSDLDLLLLDQPRLTWWQRADLRDAFATSELPFSVDVVEVQGLAEGMAQRVHGEARPLT